MSCLEYRTNLHMQIVNNANYWSEFFFMNICNIENL